MIRSVRCSVTVFLMGLVGIFPAYAQEADTTETREVVLEDVGLLERTTENGVAIVRLTDVRLRQENTYLEAERATEYVQARTYRFVGNVLIVDEGDTLTADHVHYDSKTKVGNATGNVRLSDGAIQVFAPSGSYDLEEKRAAFHEGLRLVDSAAVITSARGSYWSEEKRGTFAGDVELREGSTFLSSDSLTVLRETRQSFASGNVFVRRYGREERDEGGDTPGSAGVDSSTVTYLLGQEAFNDDVADSSLVRGAPVLVQVRVDSAGTDADTTVVRAREIVVMRSDSLDRMIGVDSVRVWQETFAAVGDSLTYDRLLRPDSSFNETLLMLGTPVAWFETTQVSGDTINVVAGSGPTDTLHVRGNAFVAQQDTSLDKINQLAGRRLVGLFQDDSLRTLYVGPNARAVRFLADDDGALSWGVRSAGDDVTIEFLEDDQVEVSFGTDTEGTAYPPALIPEPFELEGFRWEPERRPTLDRLVNIEEIARRARLANQPDEIAIVNPDA